MKVAALFCLLTCLALTWENLQETTAKIRAGETTLVSMQTSIASATHACLSESHRQAGQPGSAPTAFEAFDVADSDEFSEDKLLPASLHSLFQFTVASTEPQMPARHGCQLVPDSLPACRLHSLRTTVLLI